MRVYVLLSILCALASLVSFAIASLESELSGAPRNIIKLTDATFDDVTSQGVWFLDFYAPWCGHCQKFAPELEQAAKDIEGKQKQGQVPPEKQIYIGLIDCTQETGLKQKFKIQGYPTLLTYRAKTGPRIYRGQRTAQGVVTHMMDLLKPAVRPMPEGMGDLMAIMSPGGMYSNQVAMIFLASGSGQKVSEKPSTLTPRSAKAQLVFQNVAQGLQGVTEFFTPYGPKSESYLTTLSDVSTKAFDAEDAKAQSLCLTTQSLCRRLGIDEASLPVVVAVTPDLPPAIFSGEGNSIFTEETLGEWVNQHKLPLINALGPVNFEDITKSGKRNVFIAVDPTHPATKEYVRSLISVAQEYHNKFTFATLDGIQFSSYVGQFGIQRRHLPILFGLDYDDELFYVDTTSLEAGTGMYTQEEVSEFLKKLANNEIPPKGITAWYSPARYTRMLEKLLGQYTETQILVGMGVFVTIVSALMIYACCAVIKDQPPQEGENAIELANQARRSRRETDRKDLMRNATKAALVSDDDNKSIGTVSRPISEHTASMSTKKKLE